MVLQVNLLPFEGTRGDLQHVTKLVHSLRCDLALLGNQALGRNRP